MECALGGTLLLAISQQQICILRGTAKIVEQARGKMMWLEAKLKLTA